VAEELSLKSLERMAAQLLELEPAFTSPTPRSLNEALPVLEEALEAVSALQQRWATFPPAPETCSEWRNRLALIHARLRLLGLLTRQGTTSCQAHLERLTGFSYTALGTAPEPVESLAAAGRRWHCDL
jgi:hypothetical protein